MLGPLIVGLSGRQLEQNDLKQIKNPQVGGVILFSRNFESVSQIVDYIKEIRSSGGSQKLIFVDHEGGRVQRFRKGFTQIPCMRSIGELAHESLDQACLVARQAGFVLAAELRACDVDMSFAPILDLDWGRSEIIGDRSFSSSKQLVAQLANAVIQGMSLAGMQACGKHFPGHGWVQADSHFELPIDERDLETILKNDIYPYLYNTSLSMASIMPAHVVYEKVDDKPACFSKIWLKDILRKRLNFQGAIISDDLEMNGAHLMGNITARANAALKAGCDAVLACNNMDDISELTHSKITKLSDSELGQRHVRLHRLKSLNRLNWIELEQLTEYQIAKQNLTRIFE